jgi:hypothetical protein
MAAQQHGPRPESFLTAGAVTPSDTADLQYVANGLYVGGLGNVHISNEDGTEATFIAAVAGQLLAQRPMRIRRVWATGTTATNLVAMY